MDYETIYKRSVELAKHFVECGHLSQSDAEEMFPELAESEDERMRKEMIAYFARRADVTEFIDEGEDCKRWISYLITSKHAELRARWQQEQQPAEWSEEDEKILLSLHHALNCADAQNAIKFTGIDIADASDWLFNCKKRMCRQPHWKPSEEQMSGIACAINTLRHQLNIGDKRLDSLYEDLKKL